MRAQEFRDKLDQLIALYGAETEVILVVDDTESDLDISWGEGGFGTPTGNAFVIEAE